MRLIDGEQLYNELQELEDLAMQRQLDTPSTINGALSPMYIRYNAQTNERTAMKYKVADTPTVPAIPVPNNATNGDMIKAMFPNIESRLDENTGILLVKWVDGTTKTFKASWWNAPYKRGEQIWSN